MKKRAESHDRDLKAVLSRTRPASVEMITERSDRAIVIIGAALLEDELRRYLESCFVADKVSRELFERQRALGDFSARIDVALAAGLIPRWMWDDLDTIRRIRNHFAHRIGTGTFDHQPASQLLQRLSTYRFYRFTPTGRVRKTPPNPRTVFKAACWVHVGLLSRPVRERRRVTGLGALRDPFTREETSADGAPSAKAAERPARRATSKPGNPGDPPASPARCSPP